MSLPPIFENRLVNFLKPVHYAALTECLLFVLSVVVKASQVKRNRMVVCHSGQDCGYENAK